MVRLEDIRYGVQDWIENEVDTDQVDRAINRAIRKVEQLFDWEALRRIKTVTPDSSGAFVEPPLTQKIRGVYPTQAAGEWNTSEFISIKENVVQDAGMTVTGKYQPYGPTLTTTEEDLLVDVTLGSSTVTQSTTSTVNISTEWVGERFQLEGDATTYEITAVVASTSMTVYPSIRRNTGSTLTCKVAPAGQKQYQVRYYNGSFYTADVDVHYQMSHPALNDSEDLLNIPAEQLITLYAVQFFLYQSKYDVDARALQLAISEAKRDELAQEPSSTYQVQNRDNLFGVRSRTPNKAR